MYLLRLRVQDVPSKEPDGILFQRVEPIVTVAKRSFDACRLPISDIPAEEQFGASLPQGGSWMKTLFSNK